MQLGPEAGRLNEIEEVGHGCFLPCPDYAFQRVVGESADEFLGQTGDSEFRFKSEVQNCLSPDQFAHAQFSPSKRPCNHPPPDQSTRPIQRRQPRPTSAEAMFPGPLWLFHLEGRCGGQKSGRERKRSYLYSYFLKMSLPNSFDFLVFMEIF